MAVLRGAERRLVGRPQLRHPDGRLRHVLLRVQRRAGRGYAVPALLRLRAGVQARRQGGQSRPTLALSTPNIYSYYSDLPGGSYAVMLVNADPANSYSVAASSLGLR